MLSRLIYTSHTQDLGPAKLPGLLHQARARNLANGVTGVLLMNHKQVLQCLEGGREEVTATFTRIATDPRHTDISLLSVAEIDERTFPDWTMGFAGEVPELDPIYLRFMPGGHFDPAVLTPAGALGLIQAISDVDYTRRSPSAPPAPRTPRAGRGQPRSRPARTPLPASRA